jgi:hypothetical protein
MAEEPTQAEIKNAIAVLTKLHSKLAAPTRWQLFWLRFVIVLTFTLVGAAVIAVVAQVLDKERRPFDQKIVKLQETEGSIKDLLSFVQEQRAKLVESQEIVAGLQTEHEKLKPVVETDRKIVDAVLSAQADRQKIDVWVERGYGFIIGVFGSLAATFIWTGAARWKGNISTITTEPAVIPAITKK